MSSDVIRRRSSSVSASKTMISSIRLMNSGLNVRFTSPSTISETLLSMALVSADWKPIELFEQHDGVRIPLHLLGQLTTLFVADVARRRTDQLRDGVLLHVLRHVEA